jgi:uncharacterized protein YraI/Cu/Ag efflux protein CusF
MNKKIILSYSIFILTSFISFLFLQTHTVNAAEIGGAKDKYVAAKSGINLRSGPDKSSKVIVTIPFGSKITIEKSDGNEIFLDGRYGKWINVKYGNNTGWVFSGFLCDFKPETVIKHVADYYREVYRTGKDNPYSKYKEYTNFKDSEVSIKNIINNYIVLKIPTASAMSIDPSRGDVLWGYDIKQKKFIEVYKDGGERTIHLLYLDNDKYPDLVVVNGCCQSVSLEILLGSEKGFIKIYELPDEYSFDEDFYLAVGNCGDMEFVCSRRYSDFDDDTALFFRFNCKNKKFEKYAEGKHIQSQGAITSIDLKNMSIVIKDKEVSKDTTYKLYKNFASDEYYTELLKELKKGDNVNFKYATIDGKKIVLTMWKR